MRNKLGKKYEIPTPEKVPIKPNRGPIYLKVKPKMTSKV